MRSRTLGDKAAEQRSKLIGIPSTSLNIHKDQYKDKINDCTSVVKAAENGQVRTLTAA